MNPLVSVIIPAYNGGEHLKEAIASVLGQSFRNFELIIVNDAGDDSAIEAASGASDPRIRYVAHNVNKGAVAARRTGVQESRGEIIALLDQDDLFAPKKLDIHVQYLQSHADVGVTYNSRFDVRNSPDCIIGVWQPPPELILRDLVLGFPISPSDTVMRRSWALLPGVWDDSSAARTDEIIFDGQEIVFGGRLAMAGCRFADVGVPLNYRRYHSKRICTNLAARCRAELACREMILSDPRCPTEIRDLRAVALANGYLDFAYQALAYGEAALAETYVRKAVEFWPDVAAGRPSPLTQHITFSASREDSLEPRDVLREYFRIVQDEGGNSDWSYEEAVASAELLRAARGILYGRSGGAHAPLLTAPRCADSIPAGAVRALAHEISLFEGAFGVDEARKVIGTITSELKRSGMARVARSLAAEFWTGRAFRMYRTGDMRQVPASLAAGVFREPVRLLDRGVWAILARSLAAMAIPRRLPI